MIPRTVNKTNLHPGGVVPPREHTEIEEELHEIAHIDYDRVAIIANPSVASLYEDALVYETGSAITSTGALTAFSGAKTGRSPLDKRIVREPVSENEVWWGPVNKPMTTDVWKINRERAVDYLNTRSRIYVIDGFAGWDERYRINVRVVCARAYHALFMRNMLIRPSKEELEHFHPDYTIYNAGSFPANRFTTGMTSATSVAINFAAKEMVILGTEYAGEMKKGIFTILFYEMPVKHNVLTLHSSANEGTGGDVTVFFGLSGTGKTTLSADPKRALIGDDEHCWSDRGIFNIEGGCYAKTSGLSAEKEPDIFKAIRFGSILENVVFNPDTRKVDYNDATLTENTRCAYPIEYIDNAKIPCKSESHPTNIILLTCDARGVLPPISKLTVEQTMFHFISGYTSKMAGTEDGIIEPQATFSSCFAQPFLALHPMRYARMLANKIAHHKTNAWLLNTGWVGAGVSTGGRRCPLKYTRAILDAIHSGELAKAEYETYETFNLHIPTSCTGVPNELLNPKKSWNGKASFKEEVNKLGALFVENFKKYADEAAAEVIKAGPDIPAKGASPRTFGKDACPDGAARESSSSPSAKKLNSKNSDAIEVTGPNNEAKEGDQSELINCTGPISSTNETSSNFSAKVEETESIASRKKADAYILAKELDAHYLNKADARNVITNKSTSSESENGPDVPRNGTGHDIFTSTSPNVLRKDLGPLAPKIKISPNIHTEETSSETSTKNEADVVSSKKEDAHSDRPVSKETILDLPPEEATPRTGTVPDPSGNVETEALSSNGYTDNSKPIVIPLLSDSDPGTANGTYH